MKLLTRYLVTRILIGLTLAAIVLMSLFSFLDLVNQLDNVGKEFYTVADAFMYVGLTMPRRFIQLSPFIALMGNVIGLGILAMNLEIISMRASGIAPSQISKTSLMVGLTLVSIIFLMDQFIAPPLEQKALSLQAKELGQSSSFGGGLGVWARNERQVLHISGEDTGGGIGSNDIEIYLLDDSGMLKEYLHGERFTIISNEEWKLYDVVRKVYVEDQMTLEHLPTYTWHTFLESDQVSTLNKPPDSLSPTDLFAYVTYLKNTGQQYDAYSLALWRKIGGGLTTLAMMLLSVGFVFGTYRTGLTRSLVLAGLSGIAIYLLDQLISNIGLVMDMNPPFIALAPGLLLILLSSSILRKLA